MRTLSLRREIKHNYYIIYNPILSLVDLPKCHANQLPASFTGLSCQQVTQFAPRGDHASCIQHGGFQLRRLLLTVCAHLPDEHGQPGRPPEVTTSPELQAGPGILVEKKVKKKWLHKGLSLDKPNFSLEIELFSFSFNDSN